MCSAATRITTETGAKAEAEAEAKSEVEAERETVGRIKTLLAVVAFTNSSFHYIYYFIIISFGNGSSRCATRESF